jgi:Ca2+-binding RTX toxin-like protein
MDLRSSRQGPVTLTKALRRLSVSLTGGAALLLVAMPMPAQADFVQRDGSFIQATTTDLGPNRVTVSLANGSWLVTDLSTEVFVVAGPGCQTTTDVRTVLCPVAEGDQFAIYTGNGDDHVTIEADVPTLVCGGPGDDRFTGGPARDTFVGGDGNDSATGGGGLDHLIGDEGCGVLDDSVGTPGRNVLDGEDGPDVIVGGEGADVLYGGGDQDVLLGDGEAADIPKGGPDVIRGGDGNDFLAGQQGSDLLEGEAGDDELGGGRGDDRMFGDEGDDLIGLSAAFEGKLYFEELGNDLLDGGPGNDELVGGPGRFVHSFAANFLRVDPVEPADTGAGNGSDTLIGGDGVDTATYVNRNSRQSLSLDGQANDGSIGEGDMIESDVERLIGGSADDLLVGGDGHEGLDGGPGGDVLRGGAGSDLLTGGVGEGRDELNGGPGADTLRGGGGEDDLFAGEGDDRLEGGGGEDFLEGGSGTDGFDGGKGGDLLSARDGRAESGVNCGMKVDFALADQQDKLVECEGADRSDTDHPLVGKSVSIRPLHGEPLIRLPDAERFYPLRKQIDAPVGASFDTSRPGSLIALAVAGRTRVTASRRRGRPPTATALVSEGEARVAQGKPRRATADLVLEGGDFAACDSKDADSAAGVRSKTIRGMTVRSEGRFRARGRNSAAVGRAAVWSVDDRCDGTRTRGLEGTTVVTDVGSDRRVVVRQGSSYVARSGK